MEISTPYRPSKVHQRNPLSRIHHWIHQLPFPTHQCPHHWQELITSQSNIGWKQLLLGRFSTKWTAFHCQHLQQNYLTLSYFNQGPIWLRKVVTIIWTHYHQLWESRNKDKHNSEMQEKILLEQVRQWIAVMYQLKSRCYPADQTKWFYPTLEDHIAKEPSLQQQQGWLTTYEPMIRRSIHDRDRAINQMRIHTSDQYFPTLS
jgi:hypothetical protein